MPLGKNREEKFLPVFFAGHHHGHAAALNVAERKQRRGHAYPKPIEELSHAFPFRNRMRSPTPKPGAAIKSFCLSPSERNVNILSQPFR